MPLCLSVSLDERTCIVKADASVHGIVVATRRVQLGGPRQCVAVPTVGNVCVAAAVRDGQICIDADALGVPLALGCFPASPGVAACIAALPTSTSVGTSSASGESTTTATMGTSSTVGSSSATVGTSSTVASTTAPPGSSQCLPVALPGGRQLQVCSSVVLSGCDLDVGLLINGTRLPLARFPVLQLVASGGGGAAPMAQCAAMLRCIACVGLSQVSMGSSSLSASLQFNVSGGPCPSAATPLGALEVPGDFANVATACRKECPSACSGRGTCRPYDGSCLCTAAGSYGSACELLQCALQCDPNGGKCNPGTGVCDCSGGYSGADCATAPLSSAAYAAIAGGALIVVGGIGGLIVVLWKRRQASRAAAGIARDGVLQMGEHDDDDGLLFESDEL